MKLEYWHLTKKHNIAVTQYQKEERCLQATESPLLIEETHVPKDMLGKWYQNTFGTAMPLG